MSSPAAEKCSIRRFVSKSRQERSVASAEGNSSDSRLYSVAF